MAGTTWREPYILYACLSVVILLGGFFLVCRNSPAASRHVKGIAHTTHARSIPCKPVQPPTKLLTLFTTVKSSDDKQYIERNTVENWTLMKDRVNLILYHTEPNASAVGAELRQLARDKGWTVRRCPLALWGLPVLRTMFLDATKLFNTRYYAYSNSDVLFTNTLIDTLDALHGYRFSDVLMVGRRTNYRVSYGERLVTWNSVRQKAQTNTTLFHGYAQDYFVSTRFGYPWRTTHNLVVGRVGYDNWLMVNAIVKDIPVIDLTDTVLALHQTDTSGNFEGSTKIHTHVNFDLTCKDYSYIEYASVGNIECTQLHSRLYQHQNVTQISVEFSTKVRCFHGYKKLRKYYKFFRYAIKNKTCLWGGNT